MILSVKQSYNQYALHLKNSNRQSRIANRQEQRRVLQASVSGLLKERRPMALAWTFEFHLSAHEKGLF